MKKSYLYFVAPLVALAVFAGFYARYAAGYDEKLAAAEKRRQDVKQKKFASKTSPRRKPLRTR